MNIRLIRGNYKIREKEKKGGKGEMERGQKEGRKREIKKESKRDQN